MEYIKIEDILGLPEEELEVRGKKIKVHYPQNRDKLEVKGDLRKIPHFEDMTLEERAAETTRLLALRMLVEPKITLEQYLNANDVKMMEIIDVVSMWYAKKLKEITDERKAEVDAFLKLMKE